MAGYSGLASILARRFPVFPALSAGGLPSTAGRVVAALLLAALCACGRETRPLEAEQPQTAPNGANDPRISHYQANEYQISQGGRYFGWYGCQACHDLGAVGSPDLGDDRWRHGRGFDDVYAFIAQGHPEDLATQGGRVPVQQLWQITAYVRDLNTVPASKRRREAADQAGEPQAGNWSGPLR